MDSLLLPILLAVPLVGAVGVVLMPNGRLARNWALAVSLATLLVAVLIGVRFASLADGGTLSFGRDSGSVQIASLKMSFFLGVDSISLWLVILTAFLTPLAIAASFGSIQEREKEYYGWMLALLLAMLGVFVARDLLLFYVFFELTLIPMFFIIGIWGGPERRFAAAKFFLFTFTGSVFTLAAVIYLGLNAHSFAIDDVVRYAQHTLANDPSRQHVRVWLAL